MSETSSNVWTCKIGGNFEGELPHGSDLPMRIAILRAYKEITGAEPNFIFSGWGGSLTKVEREVVYGTPVPLDQSAAKVEGPR